MKPRLRIAVARTPDGGEMELFQHDRNFSININGQELMNSMTAIFRSILTVRN